MSQMIDNFNGVEFANCVLGQSGFNYIDDDRIHLVESEIPQLQITRLSKVSTTTRVYCANLPTLFVTSDVFTIDNAGPLFDSSIHGDHSVNWSGGSYFNCNHPWPAELGLVNDYYPADNGFPGAMATFKSGSVFKIYKDPIIEEWPIITIIDSPGASTDIVLTDIFGVELTIPGADVGALIGASFPGRWIKIFSDTHKIIAYRG